MGCLQILVVIPLDDVEADDILVLETAVRNVEMNLEVDGAAHHEAALPEALAYVATKGDAHVVAWAAFSIVNADVDVAQTPRTACTGRDAALLLVDVRDDGTLHYPDGLAVHHACTFYNFSHVSFLILKFYIHEIKMAIIVSHCKGKTNILDEKAKKGCVPFRVPNGTQNGTLKIRLSSTLATEMRPKLPFSCVQRSNPSCPPP